MKALPHIRSLHVLVLIVSACTCLGLDDEKMLPGAAGDRHLVEVTFALDDKAPTEDFHTVVTFWLSEKSKGTSRWIFNWASQGGHGPETNAIEKASKGLRLIRALDQPKALPESRNQIVTVRCSDGEQTLVRKFSIERVPSQVHEILRMMAASEAELTRLKFTEQTAEPGASPIAAPPHR
jgi:hypothetical protein